MKSIVSMSIVIGLALVVPLQAKNWFQYNLDGSLIPYSVCDSLVLVKRNQPTDTSQFPDQFTYQFAGLVDGYEAVDKGRGFLQYAVTPGYDIEQLLAELRSSHEVEFAQAMFEKAWGAIWYARDELLVLFKQGAPASSCDSLLDAYSLIVANPPGEFHDSWLVRMTPNSPADVFDVANLVFESGLVIYSVPNMVGLDELLSIPNDHYFPQQWNLNHDSTFGGKIDADIDAPEAWDHATGNPNIVVAFIDWAFDLDHEDFDPARLWMPFDSGGDSVDLQQPDFDPRIPTGVPTSHYWWGHGTVVMGYFAGKRNNSIGVAGIASNFWYMPIKYVDDNLGISNFSREWAWKWAIDMGADVISYSVASDPIPVVSNQILRAYNLGIPVICAAGNKPYPDCSGDKTVSWPASMSETIAVGASDHYDNIDPCSSRGIHLDILSPQGSAVDNWSTDATGSRGYNPNAVTCDGNQNYICGWGGTSSAAPMVSAVAALVLSRMLPSIRDTASTELIYGILRHSAEDQIHQNDVAGYDTLFGWGRLNAARALAAVCHGDADNDGLVNISDAVYMVKYIFEGGPLPVPVPETGDADGSCALSIGDAVYLINYVYASGPPPPICTCYWTM